MNATHGRWIETIFSDDVRYEVNGKLSLIGCYSDSLLVESFPVSLPKLCVYTRVISQARQPFQKLIIRAFRDDTEIGRVEVPREDLEREAIKLTSGSESQQRSAVITAVLTFSPFQIDSPGDLRVDAETELGTIEGRRLIVSQK